MLNRPPALSYEITDVLDFLITDLRRYHETIWSLSLRAQPGERAYLAAVGVAIADLHNELLDDPDSDSIG